MTASASGRPISKGPARRRAELRRRLQRSQPLTSDDVTVVDHPMLRRATVAASLGNFMEWYDFGVYGYLAGTIGKVFFPSASSSAQLLSSFATFAAAFLVRPLGGLFFGPLGDRIGRQKVLAATVIMMALGTVAVGCIPGYVSIGFAAPVLLLVARLVQGFSTGGEYGGATTFISEYSPDRRRGFLSSWLDFGTFLGYAVGSGLVTVLTAALGDDTMTAWAWRIPFWIGGPLGMIGLYLRLKLEDTPAFLNRDAAETANPGDGGGSSDDALGTTVWQAEGAAEPAQTPQTRRAGETRAARSAKPVPFSESDTVGHELRSIFVRHWPAMLVCMGLVLLYNVTNYMVTSYLPNFFHEVLGRSSTTGDLMVLGSILTVVVLITFLGRLSDRIGRRPVFLAGAIAQIVLAVPCFWMIRQGGIALPLTACLLLGAMLACFAAPTASTLPPLFPTEVRYGALAIAFNLSVSLFGGTTPLITTALVSLTDDTLLPGYYLVVSGLVGLVAVRYLRESAGLPLEGSPPQVDTAQEADELVRLSASSSAVT